MADTIDEMEINVNSGGAKAAQQAPAAAAPKEPVDLRQQIVLLAERAKRLTAD